MVEIVQHVGVTRSGKAIQAPLISDHSQPNLPTACALYTMADHFDAYTVFEYLLTRELSRRPADTRILDTYEGLSFGHRSRIGADWLKAERLALALPTIFDLIEHGKGLADRIFKD